MTRSDADGELGREDPDRLFVVTGGRQDPGGPHLDLVALVVATPAHDRPDGDAWTGPVSSEQTRILGLCGVHPLSVAELSAHLTLPVTAVRILLRDLARDGRVGVRSPSMAVPDTPAPRGGAVPPRPTPDMETLRQVLVGLQNL